MQKSPNKLDQKYCHTPQGEGETVNRNRESNFTLTFTPRQRMENTRLELLSWYILEPVQATSAGLGKAASDANRDPAALWEHQDP